jgi:hypothetical protein
VYFYGGIPQPRAVAEVQPGHLLVDDENGTAAIVEARTDAGDQVLILLKGEIRPTAYPKATTVIVVTSEGA